MANQEYIAPSEIAKAAANTDNPTSNVVADMMKNTPTEVASSIKAMGGDSGKGTSSLPNLSLVGDGHGQSAGGDSHGAGASAGCSAGDGHSAGVGHSSGGAGGASGLDRTPGGFGSSGGDLHSSGPSGGGHAAGSGEINAKPVATPYALTGPNTLTAHH